MTCLAPSFEAILSFSSEDDVAIAVAPAATANCSAELGYEH